MKRSPMPPRAKRLSYRSKKREEEAAERRIVIVEVLARDRNTCRAGPLVPEVACHGMLDVHEVVPRSAWAKGYLEPDNCVTVCRAHHDWIGDNPSAAHDVGLHAFSWERPQ